LVILKTILFIRTKLGVDKGKLE